MGLFNRGKQQEILESGLEKTRSSFFGKLNKMVRGKDSVDEEMLDDLEELLVTSDVGVKTTVRHYPTGGGSGFQRQVCVY